mmetsp:Transcript_25736/g.69853  ORF Transcript_25736/g.69853 Transcript_25736/m.69853 type:complete len:183 (+) Transcript_25736:642-1190(+)|eukprot:CAMPEP_0202340958 /NCGR_PEP_ID=MMETSP1126-20121109/2175_1 /ASSEMBLY_ACC=CAM_ASM_000457 /TAXON_ID=3047 /ORGANISM="Dunaliella tertiolecta, Strain CCMP1320" /LENGTH=182 /DNA_ID=CAMNT_0048931739 /DNA_START=67 /DNA_END=615 /DNA_ORIENTATION=+
MLLSRSLRQQVTAGNGARPAVHHGLASRVQAPARRLVQKPLPTTFTQAADTAEPETAPAPAPEPPMPSGPKEAKAHLRFQRGSVFKVRRVLDTIRGRPYEEALVLMEYMPYKACESILKVLLSAAANAKHNRGALKTKLVVSECYADKGPYIKRFRPRAKGRAVMILKPTFHMTIKVEERDQ